MVVLALDPNWVKPGWTPLLITLALALVMVVLFLSMRRQFRKIDLPHGDDDGQEPPARR